jgi:transposase
MRPKQKNTLLEWRRRRAIALLQMQLSYRLVSRLLNCALSSVVRWHQVYKKKGMAGMRPKPIPGRSKRITPRQKRRLLQYLSKGALAAGYTTELWTLKRIAKAIRHLFGIRYHANHVWRLMRAWGWSCQKPATKARERNEQQIQDWKERVWPHIKKSQKVWGTPGFPR